MKGNILKLIISFSPKTTGRIFYKPEYAILKLRKSFQYFLFKKHLGKWKMK